MSFILNSNGLKLASHTLMDIYVPSENTNPWDEYLMSEVPRVLMYESKQVSNNFSFRTLTQTGVDENGYPTFQQETVPEIGEEFLWKTTTSNGVSLKFTEGYYVFGMRLLVDDAPTFYVSIESSNREYPFLALGARPELEVKCYISSKNSSSYWYFGGIRIA